MQSNLENIKKQLNQEKLDGKAWLRRVVELQQKVAVMSKNPKNPKPVKYLLQEKDNDIQILKSKLNMSKTQHIMSPKLDALQEERDKTYKEMAAYKE